MEGLGESLEPVGNADNAVIGWSCSSSLEKKSLNGSPCLLGSEDVDGDAGVRWSEGVLSVGGTFELGGKAFEIFPKVGEVTSRPLLDFPTAFGTCFCS